MKKLKLSIATVALLASCGGETKTKETKDPTPANDSTANTTTKVEPKVCKKGFDKEATIIGFGGYKTTDKKEVKGIFSDFTVDSTVIADTPEEIFAKATISIPIDGLDTKDVGRNSRIKNSFFGNMESTEFMSGKIIRFNKDSSSVNLELTLNAITKEVVLDYSVNGDTLLFDGSIDIFDWNASASLEALNEVCHALHKGPDGVSKTWSEVHLFVSSVVKEACE